MPSRERTGRMDLDKCQMYGMTTAVLGVTGSGTRLWAGRAYQFLLTRFVWYPLFVRGWVTCLFSESLSDTNLQILCAWVRSMWDTTTLGV